MICTDLIPQGPSKTYYDITSQIFSFSFKSGWFEFMNLMNFSPLCVSTLLRCVRRYENHLNRCHPCSSAISPCGRFIATGSEDNCVSCTTLGFHIYCVLHSPLCSRLQSCCVSDSQIVCKHDLTRLL